MLKLRSTVTTLAFLSTRSAGRPAGQAATVCACANAGGRVAMPVATAVPATLAFFRNARRGIALSLTVFAFRFMVFPLKGWPQEAFRLHLTNEAGLFVMYRWTRVYHKSRTASPELDDGFGSGSDLSRCLRHDRFTPDS